MELDIIKTISEDVCTCCENRCDKHECFITENTTMIVVVPRNNDVDTYRCIKVLNLYYIYESMKVKGVIVDKAFDSIAKFIGNKTYIIYSNDIDKYMQEIATVGSLEMILELLMKKSLIRYVIHHLQQIL